ncbi:TspO/MBR family protein [Roseospira navarrensis]|uniref:Tryptophan-rich sensory protein n=1 Tax=Roseospira navarrensis TaxID=140058 RepID=A0A7X1ZAE8_9PROT|nr:TspO/MBR family protein [Roseospira navarrensis]MQX34946.1 tryptophan-rich sensory protein [Roseospira navarrensis]
MTTDTADSDHHRPQPGPVWKPIVVALLIIGVVGGAGDQFTILGPWYDSLEQPFFKPPDWAFPIGWSVIYLFTATSGVLAWQRPRHASAKRWLLAVHLISAAINIGWSYLFFVLQRPDWSLIENVFLWASVLWLVVITARCNRLAAWLLAPYMAWVTFAFTLNAAVVWLNAPFPGVAMGG